MDDKFYSKYLKYKTKYLNKKYGNILKNQTGGRSYSCDICKTAFPENNGKVINTAIVIYSDYIPNQNNKRCVYMLLSQKNQWMTPGGNVDHKEETDKEINNRCWKAISREFSEEVGQLINNVIPSNTNIPSYDVYDERNNTCTRIYCYNIKDKHDLLQFTTIPINTIGGHGFGEAKDAKWIQLDSILNGNIANVKSYVKRSMMLLKSNSMI